MSAAMTLATTRRILQQLRYDPRTVAMVILLPSLLVLLLRYVFDSPQVFDATHAVMVAWLDSGVSSPRSAVIYATSDAGATA